MTKPKRDPNKLIYDSNCYRPIGLLDLLILILGIIVSICLAITVSVLFAYAFTGGR